MRKYNKISVIIPTYNNGRYICETIQSVISQTLSADEIIIINDGSTDNTIEILKNVVDNRITIINQKNYGVSAARNRGLDIASGDFIAFLDADDRWLPRMLERQAKILELDETLACVFSNFVRFQSETGAIFPSQFTFYPEINRIPQQDTGLGFGKIILGDAFIHLVSFGEWPAFTQVMLFRKKLIDPIRFDEKLRICEDTVFALRCFMCGKVAFNDEVLAQIRRHESNATKDYRSMADAKLKAIKCTKEYVHKKEHIHAVNGRILRAHSGLSYYLNEEGNIYRSWANYFEGVLSKANIVTKIKFTIRMIVFTTVFIKMFFLKKFKVIAKDLKS
jgi:glycosyltransferase involved in cell wall biosynthesis